MTEKDTQQVLRKKDRHSRCFALPPARLCVLRHHGLGSSHTRKPFAYMHYRTGHQPKYGIPISMILAFGMQNGLNAMSDASLGFSLHLYSSWA